MSFNAPLALARLPGDPRPLWRRLFMEALDPLEAEPESIGHAAYAAALLSGAPVIRVVDALVDMGLRAPMEAFPKPWIAALRGRVLDLAERQLLPYAQASLAASWGWMPAPLPRVSLPVEIDPELDPYGADLMAIFMADLGPQPRFGYTPAMLRLALLKTAVGMGRPLAEVVTALISRGMAMPAEAVPASCRETLRLTTTHPLVLELIQGWQASHQAMAEVIPLRRAGR
jgi:hypothetical protein